MVLNVHSASRRNYTLIYKAKMIGDSGRHARCPDGGGGANAALRISAAWPESWRSAVAMRSRR